MFDNQYEQFYVYIYMDVAGLTWSIALVIGSLPYVLPVSGHLPVGNESREGVYEIVVSDLVSTSIHLRMY